MEKIYISEENKINKKEKIFINKDIDISDINNEFSIDLDNLVKELKIQKINLKKHLIKNYKININYIIDKNTIFKKHGGNNREIFKITNYTYNLLKNSYNFRNNYFVNISDNIKCINIGMCIENQTIGFIYNSFNLILNLKRQFMFDKYKVDLYFIDYNLIIECDEFNHNDRDKKKEKIREDYLLSLKKNIIRFNPNENNFDLSKVLNEINKFIILKKNIEEFKVLHINFY